jgi:hypothetical protein
MSSKTLISRAPKPNGRHRRENGAQGPADNAPEAAKSDRVSSHARRKQDVAVTSEMKWLVENSSELERYRGEWLLLLGDALLAHDRDFSAIERAIAARDIDSPFVHYVPEELNFVPA